MEGAHEFWLPVIHAQPKEIKTGARKLRSSAGRTTPSSQSVKHEDANKHPVPRFSAVL